MLYALLIVWYALRSTWRSNFMWHTVCFMLDTPYSILRPVILNAHLLALKRFFKGMILHTYSTVLLLYLIPCHADAILTRLMTLV